ncbi:HAD hydrolase subfamily IA protein [Dioscorea alata]|uniref:HAD hydrolase subfamily IA protein n=1 Tax=Dioscorea alata TaxID=55571 RepID=A0ACB7VPE1_DIOAL|nr:HAD hydrolase subfamily IA protein [Dioscorea alata]
MAFVSTALNFTAHHRLLKYQIYPSASSKVLLSSEPAFAIADRRRRSIVAEASPTRDQEVVVVEKKGVGEWGKVSAVLFDMDGVLCNSEGAAGMAAVDVFADIGVEVEAEDFMPFVGTGDANFLGSVARLKGVEEFDTVTAKKRFYEIYINKYAKPNSGIGFPGALELVMECKRRGLKVAVASSADRVKVNANLAAAGFDPSIFDAIVPADGLKRLKPAPDIFLKASKDLNAPAHECIVIEDAFAGVQAAKAAGMRCIAVMTSLSEDRVKQANPSLIRKEIGDISIQDILNDEKIKGEKPSKYLCHVELPNRR